MINSYLYVDASIQNLSSYFMMLTDSYYLNVWNEY